MLAKVLVDDISGRFKAGDIGRVVCDKNLPQYDYLLDFGQSETTYSLFGMPIVPRKLVYFFSREIEILLDEGIDDA